MGTVSLGTASVTGEAGGVNDSGSVDGLFEASPRSMVSDADAFGVIMASLTRVASDDRVVKAGTASGVWNRPTSDLGPSSSSAVAVGKPTGKTGDKPVGGVWNISTGERGCAIDGEPTMVGRGLYRLNPCLPRTNEGVGIRG